MTDRMFIKPTPQAEGQPPLKVRKMANGYLQAEGEWVNTDSYWLRRLDDGDVVQATPPAEPAPATTKAAKQTPAA
jgi:hypothetical protein